MIKYILERMPLVGICVAYLSGIVTDHTLHLLPEVWFIFLLIDFLIGIIFSSKARSVLLIALALFCLGGMNHALRTVTGPDHLSQFYFSNEPDSIIAMVEQAEFSGDGKLKIRLKNLQIKHSDWQKWNGKLILTVKEPENNVIYGDWMAFYTRLNQPATARNPGEFDYWRYLTNHHIYATAYLDAGQTPTIIGRSRSLRRAANYSRIKVEELIDKSMSGEQNAILKALIVGVRGEISDETNQAFVDTGVVHVLSVSGMHVVYVTMVIMLILGFLRIPKKPKMVLAILGLGFYALMVDLRPSVNRAVIMAILTLIAQGWEKRANVYNTIAAAALIQSLFDPLQIFDMGFQLSFMAVISIVYVYRQLEYLLPLPLKTSNIKNRRLREIWQLFLVSLSALLGTIPITVFYFQRIPIISLVTNLAVVPLVGLIGGLGFGQVILGFLWSGFNLTFGEVQTLLISLLTQIVKISGRVPIAYLTIPAISLAGVYFGYLILLILLNLDKKRVQKVALFGFLIGINFLIWTQNLSKPVLQVTFLDVGQGDAIFLEFPNRETMLIDTGDRTFRRDYGELTIAPFLKRKGFQRIDYLALSHPHNDHIGGAPYLMRNFQIGEIWEPDISASSQIYREIHTLADSLQIPIRHLYAGDCFPLAESLTVFVLHPSKAFLESHPPGFNDYSNVLKISYRQIDFLFCGDVEKFSESYLNLWHTTLQSEILKVPHHGSSTSSSQTFLEQITPDLAVISVGKNNKFRHPSAGTIARYEALGTEIHRTDLSRALIINSDGHKYWIKPW
ncbi:MAG TPA: DNA internalization-related competence protein ComEC/Rec2 [Candidatus Marinimicrobia bacterium]|nr:DNA internalization-related competence protein ComEC/Rec2 [Candidatus Neomarinimicrobiota bacterium]HQH55611.1 DNA internalization-related competence protein ComEC/Rec2 [Candidatus Neomarinimicrobiota bacterium]HQK10997.1 DNA internalization-related competence protein ComEC/Rec2 [Candidatus Neomarinimicrobiota bacterium]